MKKYLRCVNEGLDITVGNRYEIVDTENYGGCQCYVILDDRGDEHLYPVEVDEEGESYRNWFVLETEGGESMEKVTADVVEIDGVKYREVKRKAAVGELVKVVRVIFGTYKIGTVGIVRSILDDDSGVCAYYLNKNDYIPLFHREYVVLEPITADASPEIDDIAAADVDLIVLQRELNGLKRQQSELAAQVDGLTDAFAKLVTKTAIPKPKTEQQRRDEIVAQAVRDVADLEREIGGIKFVINRDKRTVVALDYKNGISGKVWRKGIAKAALGDVFNVHIGRAIALRRALGLEVPDEYTNAPQPTEPRVGDVVHKTDGIKAGCTGVIVRLEFGLWYEGVAIRHEGACREDGTTWSNLDWIEIIDDSREGSEVSAQ